MSILKDIADKIEALELENAQAKLQIANFEDENERLKKETKGLYVAHVRNILGAGPCESTYECLNRVKRQITELEAHNAQLSRRIDEALTDAADDDHNRAVAAEHELATMRKDAAHNLWLLGDSEKKRKSAEYARDQFAGNAKDAYAALDQARAYSQGLKTKLDEESERHREQLKISNGLYEELQEEVERLGNTVSEQSKRQLSKEAIDNAWRNKKPTESVQDFVNRRVADSCAQVERLEKALKLSETNAWSPKTADAVASFQRFGEATSDCIIRIVKEHGDLTKELADSEKKRKSAEYAYLDKARNFDEQLSISATLANRIEAAKRALGC